MPLTSLDMDALRQLMQFELDKRISPLEEKIASLPTKDEFYNMMDEWMVEVKEYRQEREFLNNKVSTYEERLAKIESVLTDTNWLTNMES